MVGHGNRCTLTTASSAFGTSCPTSPAVSDMLIVLSGVLKPTSDFCGVLKQV